MIFGLSLYMVSLPLPPITTYSLERFTAMHLRPVAAQARPVVPPPRKGSSTVPPCGTMANISSISFWGLVVICTRSDGFTPYWNTPGRHGPEVGRRPLHPHTTYSHAARKRPFWGRHVGLIQGNTPSQCQPAACIASVIMGSCRQSVNTIMGLPSLAIRQHSESQRLAQA